MNRKTLAAVLSLALLALAACGGDNHNNGNHSNTAANRAANANARANTNAAVSEKKDLDWNITEYDFRGKIDEYKAEAARLKDNVGTGAHDAWLWTQVRKELATIDGLKDSAINVDVDKGVITLRGNVTGDQKTKAAAVVVNLRQSSKDVVDFKNELKAS